MDTLFGAHLPPPEAYVMIWAPADPCPGSEGDSWRMARGGAAGATSPSPGEFPQGDGTGEDLPPQC